MVAVDGVDGLPEYDISGLSMFTLNRALDAFKSTNRHSKCQLEKNLSTFLFCSKSLQGILKLGQGGKTGQ